MLETHTHKGPEPRDPASMLRSYLLFLMTKPEIGLTEWIHEMKRIPYYAILSGFEPGDIPGVGTFYDFFKRLWAAGDNNLKNHLLHSVAFNIPNRKTDISVA